LSPSSCGKTPKYRNLSLYIIDLSDNALRWQTKKIVSPHGR
jgi:hypothetical protein